jgi:hypothetical protein
MNRKRPRDPIAKFQRKSTAARRLAGRSCACGESRPEALIADSSPTICAACFRKQCGRPPYDEHHPGGRANSPICIQVPVNDHRGILTPEQYDWPKETWENPCRSPLLAGAACIRGYYDTNTYLVDGLLLWVARLLEALEEVLRKRLGERWWVGTKLDQFAPRRKKDGKQSR